MTKKSISLKRWVNGREHIAMISGRVFLHCDLIGNLHSRLLRRGIVVDIDDLFEQVISKN